MSRVFLKNLNFFFEKLKILLYNMKNISERYGGCRMGIFIFIKCVRTLVALALVRVLAVRHVLVGYE